ncbi:hypothetical protein NIES2135_37870 [Leptolyngbya boryana NIES-2135]|jgi:hypothetical protein|uniref:DUF1206 domain-containing protein n=1 Tax=Leptolyngbya boryana NIES-2135 TaxID=1973484 RepID=A0A1Z4JJK6_LEPBY|nr:MULTISPECIES: DUF1206 domain-containing protein [Leptolyngbya]BAY56925.1 hypothetical protein NIES2135_37870 [Leptolyngbya boryana NIES-2135]MBD2369003.1 DUF1206 domain-containing protein [Leptolyngbya sp. FACHB-161]MBD2375789.1 DUF1206 domain-containing protein [Leptolyngbya sp. FACHB-238]MBD2399903.1 DUF1206 domain-containing protein [Leptolyngbya sp. FACHB-239]MBD2406109.1 DUF1206 domain-containing protein [Leptolyngbya sp. FACHB-402]
MATPNIPPNLKQPVQQTVAHPKFERLARFGYAAKGIVYFVVGLLAAQAAIGSGGRTTDTSGALQEIVVQPFGKFLLGLVTIGIIGYVLWRFAQALLDPEHTGQSNSTQRVVQRIGYLISALSYSGLAFTAVKLILGSGGTNGGATEDWTKLVLAQPLGQWLVGLAGAIVLGVGLSYFYQAYTAKFQRYFKLNQMNATERKWAKRLGQFGIVARGVVFCIIGLFVIIAALRSDATEVKGLGEALAVLAQQPYGTWILGIVALGLIAYSMYSLIEARYRSLIRS